MTKNHPSEKYEIAGICESLLCSRSLLLSLSPRPASAYSLLTHEQLIDLTWKNSIVPLLLSRYPNLTPAQLDEPAPTPTAAA